MLRNAGRSLVAHVGPLLPQRPLARGLPAPSASWDPALKPTTEGNVEATLSIRVHLPEDTVINVRARVGSTLMEALLRADLSDVWPGGACGGACACSTCRVVVNVAPRPLAARGDDELDMLEVAATATGRIRLAAGTAMESSPIEENPFLALNSRLSCQIELREDDDGLEVTLPADVTNALEVPLWLRGQR